ncbi:MAG: site-specific tyrosine recombinase XerD, partial [Chloroflexota bacterium]
MTEPPSELRAAVEDYLAYLRVERGLAPRTRAAYRGDLLAFATGGEDIPAWASG